MPELCHLPPLLPMMPCVFNDLATADAGHPIDIDLPVHVIDDILLKPIRFQ